MKKVGITGGIGSGKSTVCKVFKSLGVKIYNADERAKALLNEDLSLKEKIKMSFGSGIFYNNELDRKALANLVFTNPDALHRLNSIIHPAVFSDFDAWLQLHWQEKYIIKETAILFESGADKLLDVVILVYTPVELRIDRVMRRDAVEREKVLERMDNQMREEEKQELCNFIIYNDEKHSIIQQVLTLHQQFISE